MTNHTFVVGVSRRRELQKGVREKLGDAIVKIHCATRRTLVFDTPLNKSELVTLLSGFAGIYIHPPAGRLELL